MTWRPVGSLDPSSYDRLHAEHAGNHLHTADSDLIALVITASLLAIVDRPLAVLMYLCHAEPRTTCRRTPLQPQGAAFQKNAFTY